MNIDVNFTGPASCRSLLLLVLSFVVVTARPAFAAKPGKEEARAMKRELAVDDPSAKPKNRDVPADALDRQADAQTRALSRVRDQMEIDDDAEWAVISERIGRVDEQRRALSTGGTSARAAASAGKRASGNAERDALRTAVADKLPDAEIRGRLLRAREMQAQQEARLAAAQAELRAVLTVRQEAIAVIAGLLPP